MVESRSYKSSLQSLSLRSDQIKVSRCLTSLGSQQPAAKKYSRFLDLAQCICVLKAWAATVNRADKKETRRCSNAFHVSHVWTPLKFSIVFMRNEAETQYLWKSHPEIIVKRVSQPLWRYSLNVLEGAEGGSCSKLFLLARVFKVKETFHHW